ncbi:MSAS-type polyketide synthase [Aspergillus steynii IBT 23096]|uniref:6-methylsalicylic acid synthase n=1 Tax=Aspergillus steynii IBT 23096 TaxID=1392250 RepID=A0A2I2GKU6_9EURO|nr:MSAS-type polyketide synthase [Aspergillus steynii IBT 23096]PLB53501.1 MSAS-type polyketide synthase [Aspergillus steynii IBT 23096]
MPFLNPSPSSSERDKSTSGTEYSQRDVSRGVAVVGMACRAPGGINDPEQLWKSLLDKLDASGEIPASRWETYRQRNPRFESALDQTTNRGYFVENIEDFDCQFFGISPKEAELMDPQQRISLEVAWEAIENAGIPAKKLNGSDAGVFWGINTDDYSRLILEDLAGVEAWMGLGTGFCGVPNRISYHMNLTGPSVSVDAACASSLVAVHNGVQAILEGDSTVVIAGGVHAMCGPALTKVMDKAGVLAPDGRCRSFDDSACGYGRGEGAGAVVLKALPEAINDGDHILAVIKGSAVAHNGRSNGIMAPNSESQQRVALRALRAASVDPTTVQYVEAHATSTSLGDPTEISAIAEVYGKRRPAGDPCYVGSIKPNIGHLEAGAGVMGLIKAILAIQHGVIPPQANLHTLNSKIDWKNAGLRVMKEETKWPEAEGKRRAAVCSYGYGGAVTHAIIEAAPSASEVAQSEVPFVKEAARPRVLLVSAPQEQRLAATAGSLRNWLNQRPEDLSLDSICKTLAARRTHHDIRAAAIVEDTASAAGALDSLANKANAVWTVQGRVLKSAPTRDVVWVFSGHGAQWPSMGKELLTNEVFLDAVKPLDAIVRKEIESSPIEWLQLGDFTSSDRVQILTYLMQIGISAILQSQGVVPNAVIGHSVGEIAASVVAGALSPEEGTLLVTRRAVLYRRVIGQGAMALVRRPYDQVSKELEGNDRVSVAIDSSPSSCVIAGAKDAVKDIQESYNNQEIENFTVKTDIAFHSPMLDQLANPLSVSLGDVIWPKQPSIKLYSTTLADPRSEKPRGVKYWIDNMISPVRLTSAVQAAKDDGFRIFLEVSSHPLVTHSVEETLVDSDAGEHVVIPTLRRDQPTEKSILRAIGRLHCSGVEIDWENRISGPWLHGVPTAPWAHRSFWRKPSAAALALHDTLGHSLLGQKIPVAGSETVLYTTTLSKESKPFPGSHPVMGTEIIPAACLLNTFIKATSGFVLQNVNLIAPLETESQRSVQVVIQGDEVKIMSQIVQKDQLLDSPWTTHTTARIDPRPEATDADLHKAIEITRPGKDLGKSFTMDYLTGTGVDGMGFPWAVLEHHGDAQKMMVHVEVDPDNERLQWDPSSWAPFLDAATSIAATVFHDRPKLRMTAGLGEIEVLTEQDPPRNGWIRVQRNEGSDCTCNVDITDEKGRPFVRITTMRFAELESNSDEGDGVSKLVHRVAWPPARLTEEPLNIQEIVLITSDEDAKAIYTKEVPRRLGLTHFSTPDDLVRNGAGIAYRKELIVVYVPNQVSSFEKIPQSVEHFLAGLLTIAKYLIQSGVPSKLFVHTTNAFEGKTPTALAHGPLLGISRLIFSEHPDIWGGHIDDEYRAVPLSTMKYIQGADIIRILDGVARTAKLRDLPLDRRTQPVSQMLPRPEGTYLITGGLGDLGLATAEFFADHGAKRLVLLSRRQLPPRRLWGNLTGSDQAAASRILELEKRGLCVFVLSLDIGSSNSAETLIQELDRLGLPPVQGVVHAAGVLEDQLILNTTQEAFHRVLSPKVTGTLALHEAFPPGTLDFFVLFGSCGHLVGFPGQGAYAPANAFLDSVATHRRNLGDNAVSFLWSSWTDMGLGNGNDLLISEIENKGITEISRQEAFEAWLHLARYDIDHGVVVRALPIDEGQGIVNPLLTDIAVVRRSTSSAPKSGEPTTAPRVSTVPSSGPELKTYLDEHIRACVGDVLHLPPSDVDPTIALADLGMDSVMNTVLRRQLQKEFNLNVPPTLMWNHPTVGHMVGWFAQKLAG